MVNEIGQSELGLIAQKFRDLNRLADQLHEEERKIMQLLSNSCVELKNQTEQAEMKKRAVQDALQKLHFS